MKSLPILTYEKIHEDAVSPLYNYPSDSGFDLHSVEDIQILPLGRYLAPTGLKLGIPKGYEVQVRTKSGLALKQGLIVLNSPGTIDQGYTGEIKVILYNSSQTIIRVEKGQKIAQACLCPVVSGSGLTLEQVQEVEEKDRGSNGFGSTGI